MTKLLSVNLLIMIGIDFELAPDTEFENFDLVVSPVANCKRSVAIAQQTSVAVIILGLARQLGKRVSIVAKNKVYSKL